MDRQAGDLDGGVAEPVEQGPQRRDVAVAADIKREGVVVAGRLPEGAGGSRQVVGVGELEADVAAGVRSWPATRASPASAPSRAKTVPSATRRSMPDSARFRRGFSRPAGGTR